MNAFDLIYMTRKRAIAEGATHEGTHFGIPHWAWMHDENGDDLVACPKCGLLEPLIDVLCILHAFANSFRDPFDQQDFAFLLKPIRREVQA